MSRLLRLRTSASLEERRLRELLAGRDENELREVVDAAWVEGDLALSGRDDDGAGLSAALRAVSPEAPFGTASVLSWHAALVSGGGELRSQARSREGGPPTAPPEFIRDRLDSLEQWVSGGSAGELGPSELGALALARIVEIAPFDEANGRVARLAARHLMTRAGSRPPLLGAEDAGRLEACLCSAFQLETEPLATLLTEASQRCIGVMIRELE